MYEKELAAMIKAALNAEEGILRVYSKPFEVELKEDNSPVTEADRFADNSIRQELGAAFPAYSFLTEESKDDKSRLKNDFVFIVDPVDGTKEFVSRNGEFCTNIALVYRHEVVAGVINIPTKKVLYYAVKGQGAFKLEKGKNPVRIHVSSKDSNLIALRSVSFFNEKEEALIRLHKDRITKIEALGAALKFCAIAEGLADISYRVGSGTKEWDIAAGTIILKEAGGVIKKFDGTEYAFNRDDVYNREGYMLANKVSNLLF
jgi:3''-Phosphoadenosine 5''-phosphosulfate (PAPS) 3''-phosphatase